MKLAKIRAHKKLHERNNYILDFLFYTGVRASELANIKHSDYQDQHLKIHGKGNKVRYIFLPPFLEKAINPYSKDYLFTTQTGNPLDKDLIGLIVRRKAREAGINKRITTHSFRRSFATLLNSSKVNLTTIQKLLGHARLNTTASYIHNDFQTLYNDYSKLWQNNPNLRTYE